MKQRLQENSRKAFIVRIPEKLYNQLKGEAQKHDVSLAFQLQTILEERYVSKPEKEKNFPGKS